MSENDTHNSAILEKGPQKLSCPLINNVLRYPHLPRLEGPFLANLNPRKWYYIYSIFCTLQAAKAADLVKDPEHEKIVCTKWKEDGQIYRAKITCVMTEEKKVKETN